MDVNDIGTGLAILGTAQASKDVIQRILAPTADYIGAGVLHGTKATVNLARVLTVAARRLGERGHEPGEVPPRVLKNVMDQGPWVDDELMAEYMGGVLASSFGRNPRDDRAVALQATLSRLSTYALRAHYICYREYYLTLRESARWAPVYEGLPNWALSIDSTIYARHRSFAYAMGLTSHESVSYLDCEDYFAIYGHISAALRREDLLRTGQMGDREFMRRGLERNIPEDGFVYETTSPGEELLMWGLGRGDLDSALVPTVEKGQPGCVDSAVFNSVPLHISGVPTVEGFAPLESFGAI